ncbi:MAG: HutD family protein [Methylophilaceae bacterium]
MINVVIIESRENTRSPWLNGKGFSKNVAIFPDGASINDFVWRLSIAEIDKDCDYSHFERAQRRQILLNGGGLELTLPDKTHTLSLPYQSIDFSGNDDVYCHLLQDACLVLNIMYRSNVAALETKVLRGSWRKQLDHLQRIFYIDDGEYELIMPNQDNRTLRAGDALLIKSGEPLIEFVAKNQATMIEITFH